MSARQGAVRSGRRVGQRDRGKRLLVALWMDVGFRGGGHGVSAAPGF